MAMIVAISNRLGSVSPLFDVSDRLDLIEITHNKAVGRDVITLKQRDPLLRAREMADMGINVLICGAVSYPFETALISTGIRILGFVCGNLDAVIGGFIQNGLSDKRFDMPGYYRPRHYHRFRHRGGSGSNPGDQ